MDRYWDLEQTEEEAIDALLKDIECLEVLKPWTDSKNPLDLLMGNAYEKAHDQMMAWLLDPCGSHGAEDAILMKLFDHAFEADEIKDLYQKIHPHFAVYKDWQKMNLVLVCEDPKMVCVIVNDMDKPLNKFQLLIRKEFLDYKPLWLCILPDGEFASEVEPWNVISYEEWMNIVEECLETVDVSSKSIVINYIDYMRRNMVEHQELSKLCNEIYHKHKKALDLIFENRMTGTDQLAKIIRETLKKIAETGKIIYEDRPSATYFRFYTPDMDTYLLPLKENQSAYRTHRVYSYCIIVKENTVSGCFELTGLHITNEHRETMKKMVALHRPFDKNFENFRFKQLFRTKPFMFEDTENLEEVIQGTIENFIDELLIIEAQMLFNIDFMDESKEEVE